MKKSIFLFTAGATLTILCTHGAMQDSTNTIQLTPPSDSSIIDSIDYPQDTINKQVRSISIPRKPLLQKEREERRKARARYQRDKQVQP